MKIKTIGLLLSSSLILAACSSDDEDDANVNTTETEGGPIVEEEASEDDETESGTEHGGAEQDAATDENTPDEDADNEETDTSTAANPAGSSNPNTDANDDESDDASSGESTETEGNSNEAGTDSSGSNTNTIALEDISLMASDALSIAEGEFEGDVHDISFEQENGEWVYQFDMKNGSEEAEVIINHDTEEVMDVRTEQDNDNDDQDEVIDYGSLNEAYDAIDEAIADLGGGEVREWSLSMDDGTPEYDIDLEYEGQTHEYTINAETLEILESEQDS